MSVRRFQDLLHLRLGQEGRRDLELFGFFIQEDALLGRAQWRHFQLKGWHGTPLELRSLGTTPDVTARDNNGQLMGRRQGIVMTDDRPQLSQQFGWQLIGPLYQQQQGGRLAPLQHAKEALRQRILWIEQRARHHLWQQQLTHIHHLHGRRTNQAYHPHFFRQHAEQGFAQGTATTTGFTGEKNERVIEFNQMQQPVNQLPLGRKF